MNSAANSVKVHSGMIRNISKSLFKDKAEKDISNPNQKNERGLSP